MVSILNVCKSGTELVIFTCCQSFRLRVKNINCLARLNIDLEVVCVTTATRCPHLNLVVFDQLLLFIGQNHRIVVIDRRLLVRRKDLSLLIVYLWCQVTAIEYFRHNRYRR